MTMEEREISYKKALMTIIGATNIQFFKVFFCVRVKRLCARLFPGKKMSAIGKFQRNVLTFDGTFILALFFSIGAISNVVLNYILIELDQEPNLTFQIKCFFWENFLDLSFTYLTFKLFLSDIPTLPTIPRITKFYVSKPSHVPRRSSIDLSSLLDEPSTSTLLVAEKSPIQSNEIKSTIGKGTYKNENSFKKFGNSLEIYKKGTLPPID